MNKRKCRSLVNFRDSLHKFCPICDEATQKVKWNGNEIVWDQFFCKQDELMREIQSNPPVFCIPIFTPSSGVQGVKLLHKKRAE